MISIYATLSTLVLDLPMTYNKLMPFCGENNISSDVTVHLGRTLSRTKIQSVNIEEHDTKDKFFFL